MIVRTVVRLATVVATASGLVAVAAPTAAALGAVHVDCGAVPGPGEDGSVVRPYTSLGDVNPLTFGPGDQLLFKRGAVCTGMLAPQGSGTAASPWVIGDYGSGPARARIDGAGADNAVLLRNVEGVEIRDLELTNRASPGIDRRGLHVRLHDFGEGRHYVVENLLIRDVAGHSDRGPTASDGILFSVTGTTTPSNFDGVRIEGNVVGAIDYGGIRVGPSSWGRRPENGDDTGVGPWTPHTDVRVLGNAVVDVGGDGIVVHTTAGALVEGNHVDGFHLQPTGFYAGVWTINSDDTVIQLNDVRGGRTRLDGMAYDADIGSVRTLIQYNYSAGNEGGFALLCPGPASLGATVRDVTVRYNVSQNDDARALKLCEGRIERARVHNNTLYVGPDRSMAVVQAHDPGTQDVAFVNNVVVKEGAGAAWLDIAPGSAVRLRTNALVNVLGATGTGDPRLVGRATATGESTMAGYRLHSTSPAIGAATPIAGNGGRDAFGNPVSASGPENIGAYEGPGLGGSPPPAVGPAGANLLANAGFEAGALAPHWAVVGGSVSSQARTGSFSGQVSSPAAGGWLLQTVGGLAPGGTYVVAGWVASDGDRTSLGARGFGAGDVFRPVTSPSWTAQAATFTVGSGSTSAVVYCNRPRPGTGRCDDMALARVR